MTFRCLKSIFTSSWVSDTNIWTPGLTFCGWEYFHNGVVLLLISPLVFKLPPVNQVIWAEILWFRVDAVNYKLPVLGGEGRIVRSCLMTIIMTMLFLHIPVKWIVSSWTLTKIHYVPRVFGVSKIPFSLMLYSNCYIKTLAFKGALCQYQKKNRCLKQVRFRMIGINI